MVRTRHTCDSEGRFGNLESGCPRCDDLATGANPVDRYGRPYASNGNYVLTTKEAIDRRGLRAKLRQAQEQLELEVQKVEMWKEAKANVERLRKEILEATEELLIVS